MKTIYLILLFHASCTADAWSTNRLFNRAPLYPMYSAVELNPLLRPFAGKPSMYIVSNLLAVPFDIALVKMRRRQNLGRGVYVGLIATEIGLTYHNVTRSNSAVRDQQRFDNRLWLNNARLFSEANPLRTTPYLPAQGKMQVLK